MLAGFAEVEFTPKSGNMPGEMVAYFADGTIGGLFANAAAFTNGDDSVILVSLDVLSFHKEYADGIRERISKATGVPTKNILIAAIHTHTATSLEYTVWLCPPDPVTAQNTADKAVEAALAAWNSRRESRLGVGKTYETRYSFCRDFYIDNGEIRMNPMRFRDRLVKPAGAVDQSVNVMKIEDDGGKLRCLIVNYANHPDCHTKRDKFSADYPGYMRRALKAEYGDDVVVLYFNGTAGDVNCVDYANMTHKTSHYGSGLNGPQIIGEGLAKTIIGYYPSIFATVTDPVILSRDESCTLPRRKLSNEDYNWAIEALKRRDELAEDELAFATEYAEGNEGIGNTFDFEVHTIQLGPWAIVGLPSEIFSEIGHKIKAASPYVNTLVFELANGTNGYIYPDRIIGSGAYEAKYSKYNSFANVGAADLIIEKAGALLCDMALEEAEKVYKK